MTHIALIGMSNIGKTHWSDKLANQSGYEKIDCDLLVERELGPELIRHGYSGIRDVAKWMGQPSDPQYPETSRQFIECERRVMQAVIDKLRSAPAEKFYVIDTTGSVIYTGNDVTQNLMSLARVIYLEASPQHVAELFDRYIAEPKPVIWGDSYNPYPEELPRDALKRCYPHLLSNRAERYKEIAHTVIPFEQHRTANASIEIGPAKRIIGSYQP